MMQLSYRLLQEWPPLAWAAQCSVSGSVVTIYHGPRVETRDTWFCEAIWDGKYEEGGFDETDLVFGSGGKVRGKHITFVSAGTTVDRLQSLAGPDGCWVSNSLPCLLAVTATELEPSDYLYHRKLGSIVKGLDKYERELEASAGKVRLTYFNNLSWNGHTLTEVEKPGELRDFSTFAGYKGFLLSALERLATNMAATARQYPYQMLGTLSSGYDSTTNTVLAQQAGLREAISFLKARGGDADDGKEIADLLGIQLTLIPRSNWQKHNLAEVPFIAADAKGEDVYFRAAEDQLLGRVLLTGFHGDKVWAKESDKLDASISRGDRSGLSLTEYRLWAGFVHLPLPFMGVRQIKDINAISNSPEMQPWDVPGSYSRPICRRIVEEAGVQRNQFGMSKKAASVLFGSRGDALSPDTSEAYYKWLRSHASAWSSKGKTPPYGPGKLLERFRQPYKMLLRGTRLAAKVAPGPVRTKVQQLTQKLENFERKRNLLSYVFPWAIEEAKGKYSAFHRQQKQV